MVNDIIKLKNLYISKKGLENIEKLFLSELKGLDKLYFTNNIYETVLVIFLIFFHIIKLPKVILEIQLILL